ncbi:MAG: Mutator family transposase, partial [Actinomycetota bacterium]|nr:Mutator family transposase [Actinomycetota bacterium]
HDEWIEGRRYLSLDVLTRARLTLVPDSDQNDGRLDGEVNSSQIQALTA